MIICAVVLSPLVAAAGCNALIGLDDLPPEGADAGPSATDGTATDSAVVFLDGSTGSDAGGRDATVGDDDDASGDDDGGTGAMVDGGSRCPDGGTPALNGSIDPDDCGGCGVVCRSPAGASVSCITGVCGYTGSPATLAGYRVVDPAQKDLRWQHPVVDDARRVLMTGLFSDGGITDPEAGSWWITPDGDAQAAAAIGPDNSVYFGATASDVLGTIEVKSSHLQAETFGGGLSTVSCSPAFTAAPTQFVSIDADGGAVYVFDTAANLFFFHSVANSFTTCASVPPGSGGANNDSQLYLSIPNEGYAIGSRSIVRWSVTPQDLPRIDGSYASDGGTEGGTGGVAALTETGNFVYALGSSTPGAAELGILSHGTTTPVWKTNLSAAVVSFQGVVVTSTGLVIVADTEGNSSLLRAFAETGVDAGGVTEAAPAWLFPQTMGVPAGPYGPMAVGDDGILWAATTTASGQNYIYGLAVDSGAMVYQLSDPSWTSPFSDLILENGFLYATVPGTGMIVIPVSSHGYDPKAPWPVFGHDNQRTFNVNSPLTY